MYLTKRERAEKTKRELVRQRALMDALLAGGVPNTLPWAVLHGGTNPNGALDSTIMVAKRPGPLLVIAEACGLGKEAWEIAARDCWKLRRGKDKLSFECSLVKFKYASKDRDAKRLFKAQCIACTRMIRWVLRQHSVTLGSLVHPLATITKPSEE